MIQHRALVNIDWLCSFFEKSRQAYYQICRRKDKKSVDDELIVQYVQAYRQEMPRIGTRKLVVLLKPQLQASGIKCGRDKLFSLLGRSGLLIRPKRSRRCITRSTSMRRHFPNLVKGLAVDNPEQVWVGDTTAIGVRDGLAYLALITDTYSKQVMGYHVQRTKESTGSRTALRMALNRRWYPERQLIHHSDGGTEYFNHGYLQDLVKAHVKASCTAPSSPLENPVAERINGILKQEFLLVEEKRTLDQIIKALPEAIRIYNERRPHTSIDYLTPREAHGRSGPLRKRWKAYRRRDVRETQVTQIGQVIQNLMASWGSEARPT